MRSVGKSVLVLEKTDPVGGTAAPSGGVMWSPNKPLMKRAGIDDSSEKAGTYLAAVLGDPDDAPGSTPQRRSTYVTRAPEMVDFLLSQGVRLTRITEWPDYYDER